MALTVTQTLRMTMAKKRITHDQGQTVVPAEWIEGMSNAEILVFLNELEDMDIVYSEVTLVEDC